MCDVCEWDLANPTLYHYAKKQTNSLQKHVHVTYLHFIFRLLTGHLKLTKAMLFSESCIIIIIIII